MSRFSRRSAAKPRAPVPEVEAPLVADQRAAASKGLPEVEKELADARLLCAVDVATHTAMNWGARHDNEDRVMTVKHTFGAINFHTIGVLDGHDTGAASDFVSRQLPGYVERHLRAGLPVEQAYLRAMSDVEDALKKVCATAGTCVCSCTVAGPYIWCANLGDCRCALVFLEVPESAGSPTRVSCVQWMSRDHKASAPEERRRIMNLGGVVTNGRIEGLEPTRTLGDFDVKMQTKPGVISIEPDVRFHRLSGEGSSPGQALLVLATDGVWDAISGQDICDLVHARKELSDAQVLLARGAPSGSHARALRDLAEDLVQFAVARGSRDDCTAVVGLLSVAPA